MLAARGGRWRLRGTSCSGPVQWALAGHPTPRRDLPIVSSHRAPVSPSTLTSVHLVLSYVAIRPCRLCPLPARHPPPATRRPPTHCRRLCPQVHLSIFDTSCLKCRPGCPQPPQSSNHSRHLSSSKHVFPHLLTLFPHASNYRNPRFSRRLCASIMRSCSSKGAPPAGECGAVRERV